MNPANPLHPESTRITLKELGLNPDTANSKAQLFQKLSLSIGSDNHYPTHAYFIPGRIEVLGKHVDYAGGRSITCATEQGFCFVVTPRDDGRVRIIDPTQGLESSFPLDPEIEPLSGDWTNYPMTACRRIARNFSRKPDAGEPRLNRAGLRGCDIAFSSDLPQAAGLSSSSAMIVGIFMAINDINKLSEHPAYKQQIKSDLDLAGYLGAIENGLSYGSLKGDRGVGTLGGSQDHTAILCAQAGSLSCFGYRPVKLEQRAPLPKGYVFAIGVSGVHAQKTGNAQEKYNHASGLANEAASLWRDKTGRADPHLAAAIGSSDDATTKLHDLLKDQPQPLRNRVDQFMLETYTVVPQACQALHQGDIKTFGELSDRSQNGAETMLGNQVPQTAYLAKSARELGASAASAFGAGFGGSVWALIKQEQAEQFIEKWAQRYNEAHPDESTRATFITTAAGPGASRVL